MIGAPDHSFALPRDRAGIYHLVRDGVVLYVGQSRNVVARVGGHAYQDYDEVRIFYCEPEHLNQAEQEHIERFQPLLNRAGRVWPFIPTSRQTIERKPLTRSSFEAACIEAALRMQDPANATARAARQARHPASEAAA